MQRAYKWVRMLFCICLLAVLLVALESTAAPQLTGRATASSGQDTYRAEFAVDGDLNTRWSSDFNDDEWWQIAFAQPELLAGLQIVWENAYGEHYDIQLSDDGIQWHTVFAERDGDGNTDWIFFKPMTARFLRIQGRQRGTGWGYSIKELRLLRGTAWPTIETHTSVANGNPQNMVDGRSQTYWRSTVQEPEAVTVNLPYPIDIGGLEITWGPDFATSYAIEVATADGQWQLVERVSQGNGDRDFIYFPAMRTDRIRLQLERSNRAQGYAMDEIQIKGGEEQATPLRFYLAMAKERPRGWYPRWLYREQEFWTITGVAGAQEESLLSESGTFEPYKKGFTVMPFLQVAGRLFSWADVEVEQALEDAVLPLPSVTWKTDDWSLHIASVSFGAVDASTTAVRYRFANQSDQAIYGRLILATRPIQLNPKWQSSGFSPIRNVEAVPHGTGQLLRINDKERVFAPVASSQAHTMDFNQGTILDCIGQGNCPVTPVATHPDGMCEAAFVYDLHVEPGEHQEVVLVFPLHDEALDISGWESPTLAFEQRLQVQRQAWHTQLDGFSITIPELKLIHMLRSNLAYILINQDNPWIKPGPRRYNHTWMRDGAMTSLALLRMGITEPVRRFLAAYIPLVDEKGWVPWHVFETGEPVEFVKNSREGHEYDSQGQFAFLVRHYVAFTGDEALLQEAYPAVVRALRYGQRLRRERMTDLYRTQPQHAAYYGILPESNSHEGYYPAMHSYWDDFWYLRGLKDGIALARQLGQSHDTAWMQAELQAARQDLYTSMLRVIKRDHLDYLPGSVEKGDFDATSTAIAIMVSNETRYLPQPYATNTFERYYEEFVKRLIPGAAKSFTPYEVRNAEAFVRLGQRQRALNMLRVFTYDSARPPAWNHLAEVVHGHYRTPSYIGDMPHTWVGSGYISAVRALFVYEEGERLILAAGIDPEWVKDGIAVHHLPTQFGELNYNIRHVDGLIRMTVEGKASPPDGFVVRLPRQFRTQRARLNGEAITNTDAAFRFAALPATLELGERKSHDRAVR